MLERFGRTPHCPGCDQTERRPGKKGPAHTEKCRDRIREELKAQGEYLQERGEQEEEKQEEKREEGGKQRESRFGPQLILMQFFPF